MRPPATIRRARDPLPYTARQMASVPDPGFGPDHLDVIRRSSSPRRLRIAIVAANTFEHDSRLLRTGARAGRRWTPW